MRIEVVWWIGCGVLGDGVPPCVERHAPRIVAAQAVTPNGTETVVGYADGCVSAEPYCPNIVTSVYKAMDLSVLEAIKSAQDGSFDNKPYVGTLENEGTGLSPYHDFDSKVPADLKAEVDALKADIISGKIKIESKSQPSA